MFFNFSFPKKRRVTPRLKGTHALFSLPFPTDNQKTEKIMLQLRTQFKRVQPDFPLKLEVFPGRWIWLQLKQQSFFMKWNTATHSKAELLQANYMVLMTFPHVTTWKYLVLFSPELCLSHSYTPAISLIILVSNKDWWEKCQILWIRVFNKRRKNSEKELWNSKMQCERGKILVFGQKKNKPSIKK